jgi:hypothetical protein
MPRRQPRGPSALAHLGRTSRDAVPNEVRGDVVPNVVRDASLSLGRTKYGGFFKQPHRFREDKEKKEDIWELVKGGNLGYSLATS